jgi:hypothetical protein
MIYKYIISPYLPWLKQARPQKENSAYLALNTALFEDYYTCYSDNKQNKTGILHQASQISNLYEILGEHNFNMLLDDALSDIDLFSRENDFLFHQAKSPLHKEALPMYQYFLAGEKTVDGETCYEIVFYPNQRKESGFAGYLYVSADAHYTLKKAVFTLNDVYDANPFIQNILFIQRFEKQNGILVPVEKRSRLFIGDDIKGCLLLGDNSFRSGFAYPETLEKGSLKYRQVKEYQSRKKTFWENHRFEPLTKAEEQIDSLLATASQTPAFHRTETLIHLLMTDHLTIGGKKGLFEWGDISKAIAYNNIEGLQLKAEGNTTVNLSKHFLLGGYLSYGLKNKQLNYRGDIIYSFLPRDYSIWESRRSLLSFTYVKDFTIPGGNLLESPFDNIFHAVGSKNIDALALQKIGLVAFERETNNRFSFKIEGKYLNNEPVGAIQYEEFTTSEVGFSFRYAPHEKIFQNREDHIYLRRSDVEVNIKHRIGLKGIFGSEYQYHITTGSIYKQFLFPQNAGKMNIELSAGKVWNRIPFPLLFIPSGNQSYIFNEKDYNLINFHEFVTDNFVAGNMNFLFNWSPIRLFAPKNTIKTSLGSRAIYGTLSDNNNPALHRELFLFNNIRPLGKEPYVEMNIGFANIFNLFRIEYVRRLTYLESGYDVSKGSLFVSVFLPF